MKETNTKTQAMLAGNYQMNPDAMVVVDIDPPFVGVDFDQSGSDPSLYKYNDVLYLTFIDGDYIKVAIIDWDTFKVVGLLRTITAVNACRPRLVFEPSTYPGMDDLPHVAYTNMTNGKVYAYREQYDENLNIVAVYDEIGDGTSIEAVMINDDYYHFYVGIDGIIYVRKQTDYAEVLITPDEGETITGVRALTLPDGRICLLYTLITADATSEVRAAYSNLMLPVDGGNDNVEMKSSLTSCEFRQTEFWFGSYPDGNFTDLEDKGLKLTNVASLEAFFFGQIADDSLDILSQIIEFVFVEPYQNIDSLDVSSLVTEFSFPIPHYYTDSIEPTSSLQAFELFTE